jgi:hypothetical protein
LSLHIQFVVVNEGYTTSINLYIPKLTYMIRASPIVM